LKIAKFALFQELLVGTVREMGNTYVRMRATPYLLFHIECLKGTQALDPNMKVHVVDD
jgi:hypothetical protein